MLSSKTPNLSASLLLFVVLLLLQFSCHNADLLLSSSQSHSQSQVSFSQIPPADDGRRHSDLDVAQQSNNPPNHNGQNETAMGKAAVSELKLDRRKHVAATERDGHGHHLLQNATSGLVKASSSRSSTDLKRHHHDSHPIKGSVVVAFDEDTAPPELPVPELSAENGRAQLSQSFLQRLSAQQLASQRAKLHRGGNLQQRGPVNFEEALSATVPYGEEVAD